MRIHEKYPSFKSLFRKMKPRDSEDKIDKLSAIIINDKIGILNFVSSLAGYDRKNVKTPYAFV